MHNLKNLPKLRVSVTDWCNFKCTFCGGMEFPMENWRIQKQRELEQEEFFKLVRTYVHLGGRDVHFTGGEPLYRKDIFDVIEHLSFLGANVELNTNGALLTRSMIERLKQLKLKLLKVSLHSADHKGFADITRSIKFNRVIEAIRYAAEVLPVRTNMVVQRSTLNQVIPVVLLSQQLGTEKIHLLDLTYYPDWTPELSKNWEKEFVPLTVVVAPMLIEYFGGKFVDQLIFGCKFYELELSSGFKVIIKEAQPTLRHSQYCSQCPKYCHEGMFTVRVSCDGYVNICPTENDLGFDLRQSIQANTLESDLTKLFKVLSEAVQENSWNKFLSVNNLLEPLAFTERMVYWNQSIVRAEGVPRFELKVE